MFLVPTRVGMILTILQQKSIALACPHTRGDDPLAVKVAKALLNLSPHAWG